MVLQTTTARRDTGRYHGKMESLYLATSDSPAGPLHVVVDGAGRVTSVWFGVNATARQVTAFVRARGQELLPDVDRAAHATAQILEYTQHQRKSFDLELDMQGSAWELAVWQALREIPYGETRSYGQIATQLGDPGKARAVGWANAANPIPVIVPCHRVIGADRSMTGFGGGIDTKVRLLTHEGAMLPGFV